MKKIFGMVAIILLSFTAVFAAEGDKSIKAYVKDLDNSNTKIVIQACNWLGDNEKKEGNEKMIKLINHKDPEVRKWASANLGMLGEKKAVTTLIKRIQKEQVADVRYAMILALSRIGLEDDKMKDQLMKIKENETDPLIKDYINKIEEKYGDGAES